MRRCEAAGDAAVGSRRRSIEWLVRVLIRAHSALIEEEHLHHQRSSVSGHNFSFIHESDPVAYEGNRMNHR